MVDTPFSTICVTLKSRIDFIIVYQTLFAADFELALAKSDSGGNGLMVRYESLVAGEVGFEPTLPGPEPGVLPLDYSPSHQDYSTWTCLRQF